MPAFAADLSPGTGLRAAGLQEIVVGATERPSMLSATARVEVWIDLAMPVLVPSPLAPASSRSAYRRAVQTLQTTLSEQLRALGATELARVQLVRNAIAVELPASAVDAARLLPGVLRVRPVTHRNRIDPPPPTR